MINAMATTIITGRQAAFLAEARGALYSGYENTGSTFGGWAERSSWGTITEVEQNGQGMVEGSPSWYSKGAPQFGHWKDCVAIFNCLLAVGQIYHYFTPFAEIKSEMELFYDGYRHYYS
jgi:hypothetical protein